PTCGLLASKPDGTDRPVRHTVSSDRRLRVLAAGRCQRGKAETHFGGPGSSGGAWINPPSNPRDQTARGIRYAAAIDDDGRGPTHAPEMGTSQDQPDLEGASTGIVPCREGAT